MSASPRFLLPAVAIAATLVLSGCGGGSDSGLTTSTMDKAVYVKRAGAICERDNETVLGEFGEYQQEHKKADFGDAIKVIFPPIAHREAEEIRALGAPEGDEQQVEDFLLAMEEDADNLASDPAMKDPEELTGRFHHSSQLAGAYGIKGCDYG